MTDEVKTLHKKKKTNNKDLRDNLLYFHSETGRKNGMASVSYNSRVHSSIKTQNSMWAKHYNSVEIYPTQSAPSTAGSPVIRYDSVRSIDATPLPEMPPSDRNASSIVIAFATSGTIIVYFILLFRALHYPPNMQQIPLCQHLQVTLTLPMSWVKALYHVTQT